VYSGPLFGQIVEREDRRDGAYRNAGSAVDAFHRIDVDQRHLGETGFVFWVDAIDGQASTQAVSLVPMQGFSDT